MLKEVCWGMIGCGSVTEKKSGPALYKAEHSRVKGVYSLHPERAADYAGRHHIPVVYQRVEDMLSDPEINGVYISTPPNHHRAYAVQALEAGKIPYIEKPMAMHYQECREILRASEDRGLPVYVAYYRRGLEKYLKIKSLIDSGALGTIRGVRLNQFMKPEPGDLDPAHLPWRLIPAQSSGGKFVDMIVHVLDIIEFFFGSIIEAQGMADNFGGLYEAEDTVSGVFRCTSGVIISGLWCYVADHPGEEMLILGEKGHISTTGLFYAPVRVTIGGEETLWDFQEPEHVAQPYIQSIVNELIGKGRSNADTIGAANNVRIVDTLLGEYRKRYIR